MNRSNLDIKGGIVIDLIILGENASEQDWQIDFLP